MPNLACTVMYWSWMDTIRSFEGQEKHTPRSTLPYRALGLGMICFKKSIISVFAAHKQLKVTCLPLTCSCNGFSPLCRDLCTELCRCRIEKTAFLLKVFQQRMLGRRLLQGCCQLFGVLPNDHLQHQRVGDGLGVAGVLLQRLVQRGLRLFCPSQVQLCNGLRDKCLDGGGGWCLCEFFEDVECLLVLFAALGGK